MSDGPGRPDLYLADGELGDFVGWLESALQTLRDSALDPKQMGRLAALAQQFGESAAAGEIFARYEAMRARLEAFVRAQQDAIELLGIATQLMERDYVATDAEQVDQLRQIMSRFESLYSEENTPAADVGTPYTGGGGGAPQMAQ